MRRLAAAFLLLAVSVSTAFAAESAAEFAARLQHHVLAITSDPRVVAVAREASPSNVVLTFNLDANGKVENAKIVHSIISTAAQALILHALADLPPLPLNGYPDTGAEYRLPVRLDIKSPSQLNPA